MNSIAKLLQKSRPNRVVSRLLPTMDTLDLIKTEKPVLYGDEISPPVRFVLSTAHYLGIEVVFKKIDLFMSEQNTTAFRKINPLGKVPVMTLGAYTICDSHAIALFLCELAKSQDLTPCDAVFRTKVYELMFFNSGVLFPTDSYVMSDYFKGQVVPNEQKVEEWHKALDYLESKLNQHKWLVDDKMLLCDLCCGTTVVTMELLVPPHKRHVKVMEWTRKLKMLPCFQLQFQGLKQLKAYINK